MLLLFPESRKRMKLNVENKHWVKMELTSLAVSVETPSPPKIKDAWLRAEVKMGESLIPGGLSRSGRRLGAYQSTASP